MDSTWRRIIQKTLAVVIILVMTMADLGIVGEILISYAVDTAEVSNQNIGFKAYFLDDNESLENTAFINKGDLKIAIEVGVKKDGYLSNAKIELGENSNFKFKTDLTSEYIKEINEKAILLNQINEGDNIKLEVGIEFNYLQEFDLDYLTKENDINLSGIYVNSKNNNTQISGKAELKLNWISTDNLKSVLSSSIVTNTIANINESNKRVIQLLVKNKLENNSYPIQSTSIDVNIPGEPVEVQVHKRTTNASNGDRGCSVSEFLQGKITISTQNNQDNKIRWIRDVEDEFIVTAIYPETADLTNQKITTNSSLVTYDNKETKGNTDSEITNNTIEAFASIKEIESVNEIAKGKIYVGEEKDYTTNTEVYIDYATDIKKIEIEEQEIKALKGETEKEIPVNYKGITFNRLNITNILGETWNIKIKDQASNVKSINEGTEPDENGNLVVELEEGARVVYIETSQPQNNGILKYKVAKTILKTSYSRNDIKELTKIKDSNKVTYTKNDDSSATISSSATINLKETESKASLKVEPLILTTSASQEMHITAVLETDSENKDLYKNPVVKIKLPKQIKKVSAKCDPPMYRNGLEIDSFKVEKENENENEQFVITTTLKGEQKKYEGNGATLNIVANVELDKLATNSQEDIIMTYTNENATKYTDNGEQRVKVSIASENSMILTHNIEEYNISTFGKEEDKVVTLPKSTESKNAKIKMQIVNNEDSNISNVAILGKIVNISGKIDRTSKIRTDIVGAKVYYTTIDNPTTSLSRTENGWTETESKEAKYFLLAISSLEKSKKISLSYDINVGANLPDNLTTEALYKVSYINDLTNTNKNAESTKIIIKTNETEQQPSEGDNNKEPETNLAEIKTNITAKIQGTEIKAGDEVKAGEVIEYTAVISNIGNEKVSNLNITATIPEDTILVELNPKYPGEDEETGDYSDTEPYYIEKEETQLVKNNATINGKDKIVLKYMVKVKDNLSETKTETTKLFVNGTGDNTITGEFSNKFIPAKLLLNFIPIAREAGEVLEPGMGCTYHLIIKNNTNVEQKNVVVTVKENELHRIDHIEYHFGDITKETQKNEKTFTIDSIMPNNSAYVRLQTTIKQTTNKTDHAEIAVNVKDSNNIEYRSNLISEKVLGEKLEVKLEATSSSNNKYVKVGDTIKYTAKIKNIGEVDVDKVKIEEMISDYLDIDSVKINGKMTDNYEMIPIFNEEENYSNIIIEGLSIKKAEEYVIEVIGLVSGNISVGEKQLKVLNKVSVYGHSGLLVETDTNEYYINNSGENSEEDGNSNNGNNPNSNSNANGTYTIRGVVWEDKDNNGERSSDEPLLEGIKVYAINIETNKVAKHGEIEIVATTNNDGSYSLTNLAKGKYIVAFEYNKEKYMVTTYRADGVDSTLNSDAVKASRIVNGKEISAAYTDTINLKEDISNIDLGLAEAKIFSLKLDKVVSKMIITNKNGSKTYDFEDTDLAKVEISSKELSGSNVVIEYKFKVTNVGEVAGYAKTIVDHLPSSLTFNSSLNNDWYKKGNNLYTSSLADTIIEPGETKEISLTLTKKMTESNTGLTNNKAEIESAYNSLGIPNTATTEKNGKATNAGSADTIIGVKTGAAVSYVALTLTIIIVIGGLAYLVNKKLLLEKIEI